MEPEDREGDIDGRERRWREVRERVGRAIKSKRGE